MRHLGRFLFAIFMAIGMYGSVWAQSHLPDRPAEIGDTIISQAWLEPSDPDKAVHAIGGIEIEAPVEILWAIMMDCEMAIMLAPDIKDCEIIESADDGTWDIRKQKVSVSSVLPKFVTVFRSEYEENTSIRISRVRGDLKLQDGLWILEPLSKTRTRVTYQARLKPKGPVPRSLFRRAVDKDLPEILGNLRAEAERRADTSERSSEF